MKGIYAVAIAFLASWTVITADEQHGSNQIEKQGVILPVPTVCPFPEKNPHNTTTNLPHETDCTRFYKCFLGEGVLQLCPLMIKGDPNKRLHYNIFEQVCDWPWRAGCTSCPLEWDNGKHPPASKRPDPTDNCRRYFECVNGVEHPRTCPSGTCFSRTCQACVTNRTGGKCDGTGCTGEERKPHDCDCRKFYYRECNSNDWYVGECPGGLHFSASSKTCKHANEAGCVE